MRNSASRSPPVHGPVPFYAERLATPVDRFMAKVKPGHIASRLNWSVLDDPAMFQPTGKWREQRNTAITPDNAGDRSTCASSARRCVACRSRVRSCSASACTRYPLAHAIATPAAASRLAEAVRALPEATVHYKSLKAFGPALARLAGRAFALTRRPSASSQSRNATIFGCSAVARGQTSQ